MAGKNRHANRAAQEEISASCLLYGVSPARIDDLDAFAKELDAALEAGLGVFQLRLKDASEAQVRAGIERLMPICHAHEVPFVLNDDVALAAEYGCDGVHLGQEDLENMPLDKARALLNAETIIGVTAHASRDLAMEAGEQGADYVAFGAFFPTTSKPQSKIEKWGVPGPEILTLWSDASTIPCVAIGGLTPENCVPLVAAGADFIAAITSLWNHPQGAAAGVAAFLSAIEQGLQQRPMA